MIGRTLFAVMALAGLAGLADANTEKSWESDSLHTDRWKFRVTLDGRDIGHHSFERTVRGGVEQIDIEARFKVKVLFITAYQYVHDNIETWAGNCLSEIQSSTDDNGEAFAVSGSDSSGGFSLVRNDEAVDVERDCLQTFAYWNPEILEADALLNAQTGQIEPVSVDYRGERKQDVQGTTVISDEYVISTPTADITVWYQRETGRWLGLETLAGGDRVLRYEPQTVPYSPLPLAQLSADNPLP